MDAVGQDNVSQEDLTEAMSKWLTDLSYQKGGDRDDGYYGFKRRSYREQVLETVGDTSRLQRTVSEVADRYISPEGRLPVLGTDHRHKSKPRC